MEGNRNSVDVHVGSRLRLRRTLLGMSQEKLGDAVGLTFQQIQKYEKGANRIGASRLFQFSRILDVPPSFFFDDMPQVGRAPAEAADETVLAEADPLSQRETLEMMRAFHRISDPMVRKRLYDLAKTMADVEGDRRR